MAISLDKALGIHQHALEGRVKRAEVLANKRRGMWTFRR